jgi:hypothetical protein
VQVAAVTENNGDETETVPDEHRGGAAIVARRVHVDIIDDNDNLLAKQKVEYVADDVAESGDWTLAKTVETRFFETIKESYKMGRYGVLGPREWDKERFHGVEKPMLTDTLAVQREYASLKREEHAERACSGTFPDQSRKTFALKFYHLTPNGRRLYGTTFGCKSNAAGDRLWASTCNRWLIRRISGYFGSGTRVCCINNNKCSVETLIRGQ